MGLAERILEHDDLGKVEVDVPEWSAALKGERLYIRELTGAERGRFEAEWAGDKGGDISTLRVKLVAATLVDSSGRRLFSDKQMDVLGGKSGAVLARLSDRALEVSGLTETAVEEALGN